jgi:4-hydroxyphenylpyruvate dioxygenase
VRLTGRWAAVDPRSPQVPRTREIAVASTTTATATTERTSAPRPDTTGDRLADHTQGVDHIEWWVGNARAFADTLCALYGFTPVAYRGPETGYRDQVSHVLTQGDIRFVVSGALSPDSPIAHHVHLHGDGVHDVALRVDDVDRAHNAAVRDGAIVTVPVTEDGDDDGTLRRSALGTYGETRHSLIDRSAYRGAFAPGFVPVDATGPDNHGVEPVGLSHIDHVVGNVERGRLDHWVRYYETAFGFEQFLHFSEDQISTDYSALASTVMWDRGRVVFPINEPADGRRKSQIEEYLDYYRSPGVQHLALHTSDIVSAMGMLRQRGVQFLTVPPEYYDDARRRMEGIDLDWSALAELGILVDRDPDGYLLQIFTQPVCDRPTVFFELIQREGCRGFGEGNFKALFEAIERAQAARGNL